MVDLTLICQRRSKYSDPHLHFIDWIKFNTFVVNLNNYILLISQIGLIYRNYNVRNVLE